MSLIHGTVTSGTLFAADCALNPLHKYGTSVTDRDGDVRALLNANILHTYRKTLFSKYAPKSGYSLFSPVYVDKRRILVFDPCPAANRLAAHLSVARAKDAILNRHHHSVPMTNRPEESGGIGDVLLSKTDIRERDRLDSRLNFLIKEQTKPEQLELASKRQAERQATFDKWAAATRAAMTARAARTLRKYDPLFIENESAVARALLLESEDGGGSSEKWFVKRVDGNVCGMAYNPHAFVANAFDATASVTLAPVLQVSDVMPKPYILTHKINKERNVTIKPTLSVKLKVHAETRWTRDFAVAVPAAQPHDLPVTRELHNTHKLIYSDDGEIMFDGPFVYHRIAVPLEPDEALGAFGANAVYYRHTHTWLLLPVDVTRLEQLIARMALPLTSIIFSYEKGVGTYVSRHSTTNNKDVDFRLTGDRLQIFRTRYGPLFGRNVILDVPGTVCANVDMTQIVANYVSSTGDTYKTLGANSGGGELETVVSMFVHNPHQTRMSVMKAMCDLIVQIILCTKTENSKGDMSTTKLVSLADACRREMNDMPLPFSGSYGNLWQNMVDIYPGNIFGNDPRKCLEWEKIRESKGHAVMESDKFKKVEGGGDAYKFMPQRMALACVDDDVTDLCSTIETTLLGSSGAAMEAVSAAANASRNVIHRVEVEKSELERWRQYASEIARAQLAALPVRTRIFPRRGVSLAADTVTEEACYCRILERTYDLYKCELAVMASVNKGFTMAHALIISINQFKRCLAENQIFWKLFQIYHLSYFDDMEYCYEDFDGIANLLRLEEAVLYNRCARIYNILMSLPESNVLRRQLLEVNIRPDEVYQDVIAHRLGSTRRRATMYPASVRWANRDYSQRAIQAVNERLDAYESMEVDDAPPPFATPLPPEDVQTTTVRVESKRKLSDTLFNPPPPAAAAAATVTAAAVTPPSLHTEKSNRDDEPRSNPKHTIGSDEEEEESEEDMRKRRELADRITRELCTIFSELKDVVWKTVTDTVRVIAKEAAQSGMEEELNRERPHPTISQRYNTLVSRNFHTIIEMLNMLKVASDENRCIDKCIQAMQHFQSHWIMVCNTETVNARSAIVLVRITATKITDAIDAMKAICSAVSFAASLESLQFTESGIADIEKLLALPVGGSGGVATTTTTTEAAAAATKVSASGGGGGGGGDSSMETSATTSQSSCLQAEHVEKTIEVAVQKAVEQIGRKVAQEVGVMEGRIAKELEQSVVTKAMEQIGKRVEDVAKEVETRLSKEFGDVSKSMEDNLNEKLGEEVKALSRNVTEGNESRARMEMQVEAISKDVSTVKEKVLVAEQQVKLRDEDLLRSMTAMINGSLQNTNDLLTKVNSAYTASQIGMQFMQQMLYAFMSRYFRGGHRMHTVAQVENVANLLKASREILKQYPEGEEKEATRKMMEDTIEMVSSGGDAETRALTAPEVRGMLMDATRSMSETMARSVDKSVGQAVGHAMGRAIGRLEDRATRAFEGAAGRALESTAQRTAQRAAQLAIEDRRLPPAIEAPMQLEQLRTSLASIEHTLYSQLKEAGKAEANLANILATVNQLPRQLALPPSSSAAAAGAVAVPDPSFVRNIDRMLEHIDSNIVKLRDAHAESSHNIKYLAQARPQANVAEQLEKFGEENRRVLRSLESYIGAFTQERIKYLLLKLYYEMKTRTSPLQAAELDAAMDETLVSIGMNPASQMYLPQGGNVGPANMSGLNANIDRLLNTVTTTFPPIAAAPATAGASGARQSPILGGTPEMSFTIPLHNVSPSPLVEFPRTPTPAAVTDTPPRPYTPAVSVADFAQQPQSATYLRPPDSLATPAAAAAFQPLRPPDSLATPAAAAAFQPLRPPDNPSLATPADATAFQPLNPIAYLAQSAAATPPPEAYLQPPPSTYPSTTYVPDPSVTIDLERPPRPETAASPPSPPSLEGEHGVTITVSAPSPVEEMEESPPLPPSTLEPLLQQHMQESPHRVPSSQVVAEAPSSKMFGASGSLSEDIAKEQELMKRQRKHPINKDRPMKYVLCSRRMPLPSIHSVTLRDIVVRSCQVVRDQNNNLMGDAFRFLVLWNSNDDPVRVTREFLRDDAATDDVAHALLNVDPGNACELLYRWYATKDPIEVGSIRKIIGVVSRYLVEKKFSQAIEEVPVDVLMLLSDRRRSNIAHDTFLHIAGADYLAHLTRVTMSENKVIKAARQSPLRTTSPLVAVYARDANLAYKVVAELTCKHPDALQDIVSNIVGGDDNLIMTMYGLLRSAAMLNAEHAERMFEIVAHFNPNLLRTFANMRDVGSGVLRSYLAKALTARGGGVKSLYSPTLSVQELGHNLDYYIKTYGIQTVARYVANERHDMPGLGHRLAEYILRVAAQDVGVVSNSEIINALYSSLKAAILDAAAEKAVADQTLEPCRGNVDALCRVAVQSPGLILHNQHNVTGAVIECAANAVLKTSGPSAAADYVSRFSMHVIPYDVYARHALGDTLANAALLFSHRKVHSALQQKIVDGIAADVASRKRHTMRALQYLVRSGIMEDSVTTHELLQMIFIALKRNAVVAEDDVFTQDLNRFTGTHADVSELADTLRACPAADFVDEYCIEREPSVLNELVGDFRSTWKRPQHRSEDYDMEGGDDDLVATLTRENEALLNQISQCAVKVEQDVASRVAQYEVAIEENERRVSELESQLEREIDRHSNEERELTQQIRGLSEQLQSVVAERNADIDRANEARSELEETVAKLEQENMRHVETEESLIADKEIHTDRINALTEHNNQLTARVEHLQRTLETHAKQIVDKDAEIHRLQSENDNANLKLKYALEQHTAQLQMLTGSQEERAKMHENEMEQMREEISTLQARLKWRSSELDEWITGHKAELETLASEREVDMQKHENEIEAMQSQLSALQSKLDDNESELERRDAQLEAVQKEREVEARMHEAERNSLRTLYDNLKDTMSDMERDTQRLNVENAELLTQLESLKTEVTQIHDVLNGKVSELEDARRQLNEIREQNEHLRDTNAHLETTATAQVQELNAKVQELSAHNARLEAKLAWEMENSNVRNVEVTRELQESSDRLREENSDLTNALSDANARLQELRVELREQLVEKDNEHAKKLESERDAFAKQLASTRSSLQEQLEELKHTYKDTAEQLSDVVAQLEASDSEDKRKVAELSNKLQWAKKKVRELNVERSKVSNERDNLFAENTNLLGRLNALEKQLKGLRAAAPAEPPVVAEPRAAEPRAAEPRAAETPPPTRLPGRVEVVETAVAVIQPPAPLPHSVEPPTTAATVVPPVEPPPTLPPTPPQPGTAAAALPAKTTIVPKILDPTTETLTRMDVVSDREKLLVSESSSHRRFEINPRRGTIKRSINAKEATSDTGVAAEKRRTKQRRSTRRRSTSSRTIDKAAVARGDGGEGDNE